MKPYIHTSCRPWSMARDLCSFPGERGGFVRAGIPCLSPVLSLLHAAKAGGKTSEEMLLHPCHPRVPAPALSACRSPAHGIPPRAMQDLWDDPCPSDVHPLTFQPEKVPARMVFSVPDRAVKMGSLFCVLCSPWERLPSVIPWANGLVRDFNDSK